MPISEIISLADVNLSYQTLFNKVDILKNVSLTLKTGKTLSIVGPSGAGKTSLLMIIGGMERSQSGDIFVAEQDITLMSEDELARFRGAHIGVVFQSFHLIPTMTALENVLLPLEFANTPNARELAIEELTAVGLAHRLDHYPGELSGGEQQRVSIARALAPKPSLLIADEPTGNLDRETGQEIINLIFKANKDRDMSLVLVTHDLDIAKMCDEQVTIEDGTLVPHQL